MLQAAFIHYPPAAWVYLSHSFSRSWSQESFRGRKFGWIIRRGQLKTVQFLACQRLHDFRYWFIYVLPAWFWDMSCYMFFKSTRHNSCCWLLVKHSRPEFVQELFPDWPTPMISDQECAPQLLQTLETETRQPSSTKPPMIQTTTRSQAPHVWQIRV